MLNKYTFGISSLFPKEIEKDNHEGPALSADEIVTKLLKREWYIFQALNAWTLLGRFLCIRDTEDDINFYKVKIDGGVVILTELKGYPKVKFPTHTVEVELQGIDFMETGFELDL